MKSLIELTKESLHAHIDFMCAARKRHLTWAREANNIEAARVHLEIASSIEQMLKRYDYLLDLYPQRFANG